MVKGGRMIKLVECLRNSDDNDGEVNIKMLVLCFLVHCSVALH
jgi:E3 ubiquitin-protein ligase RNF1/2